MLATFHSERSRGSLRSVLAATGTFALLAAATACSSDAPTEPTVPEFTAPTGEVLVTPGIALGNFSGVSVSNGGYGSAFAADRTDPSVFYLMTDRGANVAITGGLGFAIPNFAPHIGKFRLQGNALTQIGDITLKAATGVPLTGLPRPNAESNRTEVPLTFTGLPLAQDPFGMDSEGLGIDTDGSFWVSDEYGPDIVHFGTDGRVIKRLTPGDGLPKALGRRRANRGMEGLTVTPNGALVVGIMQSPLDNPTAGGSSAGRSSRLARIVVYNKSANTVKQYAYLLEAAALLNSEITAITDSTFLVLERDGNFPNGSGGGASKKVYKISLTGATDISDPSDGVGGKLVGGQTLEELTKNAADPVALLATNSITPVTKSLVVDILAAIPTYPHDKVEGLAVINGTTIAISNDDDFGVGDDGAGHFIVKALPAKANAADYNTVYFIRLTTPIK